MCIWSTISFGCGHHEANVNVCLKKKNATELGNPFWHTTPCEYQEAYAEQPKSCALCTAKIQAAISHGQQRQHVLGHDPRDALPSQIGRKAISATSAGPRPPLSPPRLASLRKKRKNRPWKASAEATALEWARLSALSDNISLGDDISILPANGIVKIVRGDETDIIPAEKIDDGVTNDTEDDTEHLWVTAAAHQRMCEIADRRKRERQQQRTVPNTIPRKAINQQDPRAREKIGTLRQERRAAEPGQQSDSALLGFTAIGEPLPKTAIYTANQESTELFLGSKQRTEAERFPLCLVAGITSARLSQLSADFEAARTSRQDIPSPPERQKYQALNLNRAVGRASNNPSIFVSMFDSKKKQQVATPVKSTSVVMIESKQDARKHQSKSLPYQLPISKRISTLHFEGTILESPSLCETSK